MLHKIEVKFFKFSIYCTVDNNVKQHDLDAFRTYGWHVEVKSEFFSHNSWWQFVVVSRGVVNRRSLIHVQIEPQCQWKEKHPDNCASLVLSVFLKLGIESVVSLILMSIPFHTGHFIMC